MEGRRGTGMGEERECRVKTGAQSEHSCASANRQQCVVPIDNSV